MSNVHYKHDILKVGFY